MARQLTLNQLLVMERLHGRQYYQNGGVRTRQRSIPESRRLGIPPEHEQWWCRHQLAAGQYPPLAALLEQITSSAPTIQSPHLKEISLRHNQKEHTNGNISI